MSLKDAIREAVDARDKQDSPSDDKQEINKAVNTASNKAVNTARNKAVNTARNKAVNTASNKAPVESEKAVDELAAMTIRVSRRHRIHWLISAKKEGTSLTAAITEALNTRFGEPSE